MNTLNDIRTLEEINTWWASKSPEYRKQHIEKLKSGLTNTERKVLRSFYEM